MAGNSLDELLDQLNAKDREIEALNQRITVQRAMLDAQEQPEDQGAWAAWVAGTAQMSRKLLTDAETWAVYNLALHVISDRDAMIRRLQAELDLRNDTNVLMCMERDAPKAMEESRHENDGTVLRATDTGRAWVLRAGMWELKP
jgi:hypothetical protein